MSPKNAYFRFNYVTNFHGLSYCTFPIFIWPLVLFRLLFNISSKLPLEFLKCPCLSDRPPFQISVVSGLTLFHIAGSKRSPFRQLFKVSCVRRSSTYCFVSCQSVDCHSVNYSNRLQLSSHLTQAYSTSKSYLVTYKIEHSIYLPAVVLSLLSLCNIRGPICQP